MNTELTSRPAEKPSHESGSQHDKSPPTCFLDILPTEVLDNVFRFFSRLPAGELWENHIPLKRVVDLYAVGGAFIRLFRNRFRTLCISRTIDCWDENRILKWKLRGGRMLCTSDIAIAHDFILAGGGEFLHTLIVGRHMYDEKLHGTELVDNFRANCPNLASLSIQEQGSVWTSRFGENIEKYEIRTPSSFSFLRQCTNLREVTAMFPLNVLARPDLWEKIGKSLEALALTNSRIPTKVFGSIEKYCRNIRRISVWELSEEGKEAIAKLLASYADQLQYAEIYYLKEYQWNRVLSVCTKARFNVFALGAHSLIPSLNIAGYQMEKISAWGMPFAGDEAEFRNAWNKCVNLNELRVQLDTFERFQLVLSTPKVHLKNISIDFDLSMDENEMKNIVKILSKGTTAVEKFSFTCRSRSMCTWDIWGPFFELNRSSLSQIYLPFDYQDKEVRDILEKLLCPSALKEITCNGSPDDSTMEIMAKFGIICRGVAGSINYHEPPKLDWNLLV